MFNFSASCIAAGRGAGAFGDGLASFAGGWLGFEGFNLLRAHQRLHRIGQRAVPVLVETARQIARDAPGCQHVDIDKIGAFTLAKVCFAQIAPAGDGHGVVGDEHFVVHAPLHARRIVEIAQNPQRHRSAPARQRVEQAQFNIPFKSKF